MADFNITFNELDFVFSDNTDYSDLTITKTDLLVTYPNIGSNDPITLDLYDENIASLGDNFTFTPADELSLSTLVDGVYKFTFKGYNGGTEIFSVTKYFIYYFNLLSWLRLQSDLEMDKQCSDKWLEIGRNNGMLRNAIFLAENDEWIKAQEIMDFLIDETS